ncbi:hypothetical protein [Klebsiella pneumoniae IS43]|uniref:Uncharacterized protein n=1 Tax=Klebsiella pneumoniae IS43 TaxID=1432552 RepID=W1DS70_KLEPN|nr:hypothetical protein [Klebsiella pneumoniae IS43]
MAPESTGAESASSSPLSEPEGPALTPVAGVMAKLREMYTQ